MPRAPKSVYVVLKPVEIKAIRTSVGMSQSVSANTFRLRLDTLKGWERGKRQPDATAANFLRPIKADPEFVQNTLAACLPLLVVHPRQLHGSTHDVSRRSVGCD